MTSTHRGELRFLYRNQFQWFLEVQRLLLFVKTGGERLESRGSRDEPSRIRRKGERRGGDRFVFWSPEESQEGDSRKGTIRGGVGVGLYSRSSYLRSLRVYASRIVTVVIHDTFIIESARSVTSFLTKYRGLLCSTYDSNEGESLLLCLRVFSTIKRVQRHLPSRF